MFSRSHIKRYSVRGVLLALVLVVVGILPPAPRLADAQGDAEITDVSPIQVLEGFPLVLEKETVVRVGVRAERAADVTVAVSFDGRDYEEEAELEAGQQWVDVFVDPPQQPGPLPVTASLSGDVEDEATVDAFVVSPTRRMKLFYLPVDWTPEERRKYNYDEVVASFTELQTDYVRALYPLPGDWVESSYAPSPHMVAPHEKALVNDRGQIDSRALSAFYGTLYLAARRYAPDADFSVAMLPPDWFAEYLNDPNLLGQQWKIVNNLVLSQVGLRGRLNFENQPPLVTAHELGHTFGLGEDYDASTDPPQAGIPIDALGYWVTQRQVKENTRGTPVWSVMSAAGLEDYWNRTELYAHFMRALTDWDGRTGLREETAENTTVDEEPDFRAATVEITMAEGLDPRTYEPINPTDTYRPDDEFAASLYLTNIPEGIDITTRWYIGSVLLREGGTTARQNIPEATVGVILSPPEEGWEEGDYRLEIYLADELKDTAEFSVE